MYIIHNTLLALLLLHVSASPECTTGTSTQPRDIIQDAQQTDFHIWYKFCWSGCEHVSDLFPEDGHLRAETLG